MAGFKFDIKGADKLLSKLDKLPKQMQVMVDRAMGAVVTEIHSEQQARAKRTVDTGRLWDSIMFYKISDMNYALEVNTDYAAYVEFGTGAMVDVPAGLENYAMQFKGKGERQVNLPARPFFFPPFYQNVQPMINDIKRALKDL